ncbi:ankyrin [Aspergillus japonicus CBS 114.51]|uniref:Ankyrin n=2 Tax=Aspergillus TaxID=5052 RepID=A0A8T8X4Q9_ASPJA|nr:ankyrin [Aspergillus japonicus CBS 114.51]RAH83128.1 ankyrin [Aspergillus japonicus CBS 114.51]
MDPAYLEVDADWTLVSNSDARDVHEFELDTYTLCTTGSSPDAADMLGWTPLSWAAKEGHEGVVRTLLAKGATPDLADAMGRTPLFLAAEVIRTLLEYSVAELDAADMLDQTPLSRASKEGHVAAVRHLQDESAAVHPADV